MAKLEAWERSAFDQETHVALVDGFLRHRPGETDDARLFVKILGGFGEGLPSILEAQPEQNVRRRSLRELGTAAAKVADLAKTLDSGALGCAIDLGNGSDLGSLPLGDFMREVNALRHSLVEEMTRLSEGAYRAAKELPVSKFNARLNCVVSIQREFATFGLPPFTDSDSGFAADCIRAVFELAGVSVDDPRYWMRQAMKADPIRRELH